VRVPALLSIIYNYYNTTVKPTSLNRPNFPTTRLAAGAYNPHSYDLVMTLNPTYWSKPYRPVGLRLLAGNKYLVILK
jgi:hypothetical protein